MNISKENKKEAIRLSKSIMGEDIIMNGPSKLESQAYVGLWVHHIAGGNFIVHVDGVIYTLSMLPNAEHTFSLLGQSTAPLGCFIGTSLSVDRGHPLDYLVEEDEERRIGLDQWTSVREDEDITDKERAKMDNLISQGLETIILVRGW